MDGESSSRQQTNENSLIDFLKDEPSEMTIGRRLALWLMKYEWYYPNSGGSGGKNSRNVDGNSDGNVDENVDENVDANVDENISSIGNDDVYDMLNDSFVDNVRSVATETRHNTGGESNILPSTIQISGTRVEGMDTIWLGAPQVFDDNNDYLNNFAQQQPSLEKAWAHFEHNTLPRCVYNDRHNLQEKTCCKWLNQNCQEDWKIAKAGEKRFTTKLFHPALTPLHQLGDFGMGIALYFTTLRAMTVLLAIAGLVSLPNILYFSGPEYSNNQEGVFWPLKGSSVCTNYEFVPCLDCNESNFKNAMGRYRTVTNYANQQLAFALKNNCDGANKLTIMTNLVMMLVVIIGMVLIYFYLAKKEVEFDEGNQTARDYSIEIVNAPVDAGDPEEWRDFFMDNFDDVHVTCCTIAVHNERLVKKLVVRREILHKIRKSIAPGESLENDSLQIISDNARKERCCKLFNYLPELYEKLLKLEGEIRELLKPQNPVSSVFITLETKASQRKVLKALRRDFNRVKDGDNQKYFFQEGHEPLIVRAGPEPSTVRWQDLSESQCSIIMSMIKPYVITAVLIASSALVIWYLQTQYPDKPSYVAYAITFGNLVFPVIASALTNSEIHPRKGEKETSLYVKNAAFRWVNSAIVITLITPFTSMIMPGKEDLIWTIYSIYFLEIVIKTILDFLNIMENVKHHILAPRAKTQEDMNNYMGGIKIDLVERYTTLTKVLFLSLWYSSIYPTCLFLGAVTLMLNLKVDQFSLMRRWAPSPKIGNTVSRINRRIFIPITIMIVVIISSYNWTAFTFDNLCSTDQVGTQYFGESQVLAFGNDDNFITISVSSGTTMYRYCKQNYFSSVAFPAIPSLQRSIGSNWMSSEQRQYSEVYGWFSIAIFVAIIVILSYATGYNTGTNEYKLNAKAQHITFTRSGAGAYIPEIYSDLLPFPLVACAVAEIENVNLFDWVNQYHPYVHYDLTLDAAYIMKESDGDISDLAFSKVQYWEPSIM